MSNKGEFLQQALNNARRAYRAGDYTQARYWAHQAITLSPEEEEAWLWLAAVSNPRASVEYLNRALHIAPQSARARKGMHWAIKRLRERPPPSTSQIQAISQTPITTSSTTAGQPSQGSRVLQFTNLQWVLILMILSLVLVAMSIRPMQMVFDSNVQLQSLPKLSLGRQKASDTPLPTFTATFTTTPTSTATDTPTATASLTATPIPSDTPIPPPSNTPVVYEPPIDNPGTGSGERWIDVDLTLQRVYAYEGNEIIRTFVVSTGTWLHPTVTGQYNIYVKYESAPMSGPDYYLPGVPYIMYFYKGYGLHGTYWHDNFGVPMSHGCINLRTPDAEWLFYWASIGTLVNIHY